MLRARRTMNACVTCVIEDVDRINVDLADDGKKIAIGFEQEADWEGRRTRITHYDVEYISVDKKQADYLIKQLKKLRKKLK